MAWLAAGATSRAAARNLLLLLLVPTTAGPLLAADGAAVEAELRAAELFLQRGELRQAQATLERVHAGFDPSAPEGERALVLARLGAVLGELGDEDERAARLLLEAIGLAGEAELGGLQAEALNDLGNVELKADPARALRAYEASVAAAARLRLPALLARASTNAARTELRLGGLAPAAERLGRAERALAGAPPGATGTLERAAIGGLALELARQDRAYLELAHRTLTAAQAAAERGGSERDRSWATGLRGELYALDGRAEEALALYHRAALDAEAADAPEVLFRWQWLAGRVLAAQGRRGDAITAYRGAVRNLDRVRLDLPAFDPRTGRSLFRETLGPVFIELADLLLQEAGAAGTQPGQVELVEARATIERLKTVELEDYFRDDCAADLTARVRPIDQPGTRTAVLYPVLLGDRTELILSLPDGRLVSARAPMTGAQVTDLALRLRRALEVPGDDAAWLRLALPLYDQLVRPVEALLERDGVETLVFVPDGALRNIPLAALHDGEHFVAERFAVATGLGLNLLDTRPLPAREVNLLVGGLTEARGGFTPLPGVKRELDLLASVIGPGRALVDQGFVRPALQQALERVPFNVIHLASHGEFTGNPENSFILTWDGQLNMDQLEQLVKLSQFRDQPVELLTLSACRTAAGDDRSALGLAGLAVKVGARSALATLWEVDDASTAPLMARFYENLLRPGVSKATALTQAQRTLMADRATRHPYYWAPFLLIGNWL